MIAAKKINDVVEEEETGGALITVEGLNPVELFKPGGTDHLIERVRKEAESHVFDPTTEEGRKEARRLATRVNKGKDLVSEMKLKYTETMRQTVADINAEGTKFTKAMDAIRADLTREGEAWVAANKAKVEALKVRLQNLNDLGQFAVEHGSAMLQKCLDSVPEYYAGDWGTFADLALEAKNNVEAVLSNKIDIAKKNEAQAEELAQLRKDKEERERKDREDEIAKTAADKAKKDVEKQLADANAATEKAESDRKSRLRNNIMAMRTQGDLPPMPTVEQVKMQKSYLDRIYSSEPDWAEFMDDATTVRDEIAKKLSTELSLAEDRAEKKKADDEAAAIKRQKDADDAAQKLREANEKHRADIMVGAITALINAGIDKAVATEVIAIIGTGSIPNVKIIF